MNQARADDMKIQGEGVVTHAPGTQIITVICDPTLKGEGISALIRTNMDHWYPTGGYVIEEEHIG